VGASGHQQVSGLLMVYPSRPEETSVLTDTALRNLKLKSRTWEASGREGTCATVSASGTVTFRYDY